ncbi:UDP-N-acetylmuramate dehydrogenase [Syntrophomonas palmitatica]|uniref:UDP-N-acetylmuramate dehydrogenase n=1 Tax=Syntrophomonas palmitatica TaxID=402877 RepID=UPI0034E24A7C
MAQHSFVHKGAAMYSIFADLLSPEQIRIKEPMSLHTSFKIGGPADILLEPNTVGQVENIIKRCMENRLQFTIIGAGTNVLVRDKGIRGVVIKLGEKLNSVNITGDKITAEAGIALSELVRIAARHGLSGIEFAEGIPGTLGGAVVMNAGAYEGEMQDVLLEVKALSPAGQIKHFKAVELNLSYRYSIFQENQYIVLGATLQLKEDNIDEIMTRINDFHYRRFDKQPMEMPSAGSTFRRPEGHYVGPMIEKLGLKGYRVGGAQVSTKHAGFIVNTGNATADNVLQLIAEIQASP